MPDVELKQNAGFNALTGTSPAIDKQRLVAFLGGIMSAAMGITQATNIVQWGDEISVFVQGQGMVTVLDHRLS
jgi:hypothetical protein